MSSFAELAVVVSGAATRECYGAEILEIWAASDPDHAVFATTHAEVRATAKKLGEVYVLLRQLEQHEPEIRRLIGEAS